MRNPFRDRRDVTLQAGADPAKNKKAKVAFPAFNRPKIASVQSAMLRKVRLAPAQTFSGSFDSQAKF